MKERKLTDKELETFARAVVAAGRDARDIDALVSDPKLYQGVLSKIADECEMPSRPSRFAWKPVVAFAAVVIIVSATFVAYFLPRSEVPRVNRTTVPDIINDEIKPRPFVPLPDEVESDEPGMIRTAIKPVEKPQPVKPRRRTTPPVRETEPPVFHPIGFAERAVDAAIDGRVVRVEMPRSALFALGVDLPLENGTRSVKADLLVGADGSPRAIRLVE